MCYFISAHLIARNRILCLGPFVFTSESNAPQVEEWWWSMLRTGAIVLVGEVNATLEALKMCYFILKLFGAYILHIPLSSMPSARCESSVPKLVVVMATGGSYRKT